MSSLWSKPELGKNSDSFKLLKLFHDLHDQKLLKSESVQ